MMYLAYARHDPDPDPGAVLAAATLLLDAGADPNAGRLWHRLPMPFTLLTGVFGEGEQDAAALPRHPVEQPLARLLLTRGADPNDGQTLYNRMFGADDGHLRLLFAHGLGRGDGGVWRARFGADFDPPERLLAAQLGWAVAHDMRERVRLLDHGVPVDTVLPRGLHGARTAAEAAARAGNAEIVAILHAHGARPPLLDDVDALVTAALAADRVTALAAPGEIRARARATRPGTLVWAAAQGRRDAVALLLDLGFDVDGRGRGDLLVEQPWATALHEVAHRGDAELAGLLLDRGADPTLRDARFDATPAGWAEHGGHPRLAALLAEREATGTG